MENQNGTSVKSNNPAPTVEQINADRITQVLVNKYIILLYITAIVLTLYFSCSLQINIGHLIQQIRIFLSILK